MSADILLLLQANGCIERHSLIVDPHCSLRLKHVDFN